MCLFTNLHAPADRTLVCAEGLLHEAVHQYLYKMERDRGNFSESDRNQSNRSDNNDFRPDDSANRRSL